MNTYLFYGWYSKNVQTWVENQELSVNDFSFVLAMVAVAEVKSHKFSLKICQKFTNEKVNFTS